MARMIEGGSDIFDALAFSMPQPGVYQFLQERAAAFSQNLTQAGQQFITSMQNTYAAISESEALKLARIAARKVGSLWQNDAIRYMVDVAEFQAAGLKMQRWIMAEPTIRQMYHNQQCEGYDGTYVDNDPGMIGNKHYDYRRATNGIVMCEGDEWYANTFIEELKPGDRDLTIDEQADILDAWEAMRYHIKQRKSDPTSRFGGNF